MLAGADQHAAAGLLGEGLDQRGLAGARPPRRRGPAGLPTLVRRPGAEQLLARAATHLRAGAGALVVACLAGPVAARVRAPLTTRVILEEHQDAAGGAAGPQVGTVRPGQQIDRVGGQDGKHDVGTRCAMDVGARERTRPLAASARRATGAACAVGVDRVERGALDVGCLATASARAVADDARAARRARRGWARQSGAAPPSGRRGPSASSHAAAPAESARPSTATPFAA